LCLALPCPVVFALRIARGEGGRLHPRPLPRRPCFAHVRGPASASSFWSIGEPLLARRRLDVLLERIARPIVDPDAGAVAIAIPLRSPSSRGTWPQAKIRRFELAPTRAATQALPGSAGRRRGTAGVNQTCNRASASTTRACCGISRARQAYSRLRYGAISHFLFIEHEPPYSTRHRQRIERARDCWSMYIASSISLNVVGLLRRARIGPKASGLVGSR